MSGAKPTLSKALPQVYVDLSSIAKGFGVDQVAEKLEQLNAQNYMVEIGGEIRAKGKILKVNLGRLPLKNQLQQAKERLKLSLD